MYQEIQSKAHTSSAGLLVEDIKEMQRFFVYLKFSCVKRLANRVAHLLVRNAVSLPDHGVVEWFHFSPVFIHVVLISDLLD